MLSIYLHCEQCIGTFMHIIHVFDIFHIACQQSATVATEYPTWVMAIGLTMIVAGVLPMPAVYLLRRFQILKVDLDIHQGSIRRNETTASTKQMMDDDDVSNHIHNFALKKTPNSLTQTNGYVSVLFLV